MATQVNRVMNITDVGHLTSDADEGEDKMAIAARRSEQIGRWKLPSTTPLSSSGLDHLNYLMPRK